MTSIKDFVSKVMVLVIMWIDDVLDILKTVVITLVVCFLLGSYIVKPVVVSGTSMYPTIQNGARGLSSIISKSVDDIERFDIVVINLEEKDELIIKRVIGLPGETITFENDNLYVNGVLVEQTFLDEDYVNEVKATSSTGLFTDNFTVVLGDDEYFCMGDNRRVSADSRIYGAFSSEDIVCVGLFVVYPFNQFGFVE